ncbi:hypothetical protein BD770DRAFT_418288 [Pilaira anomala]|nr:hypothetical protein BD770DRAFT_418288 [Pilaira anomala]
MANVLKDMLYLIYQKYPDSLRKLALLDTKFTIVTCNLPAGYVCRINHKRTLELPEEADNFYISLLPILSAAYKTRVMIESTNKIIKQNPVDIEADPNLCKAILPSTTGNFGWDFYLFEA